MELERYVQDLRKSLLRSGSPLRLSRKLLVQLKHRALQVEREALAEAAVRRLTAPMRGHVEALASTGYARIEDGLDAALVDDVSAQVDARTATIAEAPEDARKKFWVRLRRESDLDTASSFVKLALSPFVVDVVTAAFGELPYLADIEILAAIGTKNTAWQESQKWHRDYADTKTIKLFGYLTDVTDAADGPFTFHPLPRSRAVKNQFLPTRIEDDDMVRQTGGAQPVQVLGPRKSFFFIDTANCYHQGSRTEPGHLRVAYVATFITHSSMDRYDNRIHVGRALSRAEQLLLTTSP